MRLYELMVIFHPGLGTRVSARPFDRMVPSRERGGRRRQGRRVGSSAVGGTRSVTKDGSYAVLGSAWGEPERSRSSSGALHQREVLPAQGGPAAEAGIPSIVP